MSRFPLNGEYYTEADDLEMLSHPEDWPAVLHVKRGSPATEHGIMQVVAHVALLIHFGEEGRPAMHYESAAAMVADGWRVD